MGDNQGTGEQHKKKRNTANADWKYDNKSGSGKIWHKVRNATSAFASWMASKLSFNNTTRQRQETFDLLDCGPRNRFVVLGSEGPLIVHNCGAVYSDNKEVIEFDCSSRQEALLDIIEEASKKVIVFATFRHSIAMLEDLMNRNNIPVGVIHGQVSLSKRSALVEEFQSTPEPRVLILQPRSASHGITLTAANVVVWWTPTPSVETYLQANDRVHRAGQDAPCTVIHLCGSPVEERFYKTLEHKGNLLDDLLGLYKDVLTL
jgi:SNF2 family DNA or RNA helicase